MEDVCRGVGWEWSTEQKEAYSDYISGVVQTYQAQMRGHTPSAESMAEMRAAFGSGVTVVNVITGQRYRT